MCWEPRSSDGFGGTGPDGSTVRVCRRHGTSTSSRPFWPASTFVRPAALSRPRYSHTRGLRRSASTSTTFDPVRARVSAMLQADVDLPSFGIEEVTTMVRGGLSTSAKRRFVRSMRNASARLSAWSAVTSGWDFAIGSKGTTASGTLPVRVSMSSGVLTVVLSCSRSRAPPAPAARPTSRPRARFRLLRGATGAVGTDAGCVVVSFTGAGAPLCGLSMSCTTRLSCLATPLAMSAARFGSVSVTAISMSTVSRGLVTVTFFARSSDVFGSFSCWMTGPSTWALVATCVYDLTRCRVNWEPERMFDSLALLSAMLTNCCTCA